MGAEAKLKGINVLLAPSIGALRRMATASRTWEGISNDPYLCDEMGARTVTGLPEDVLAVAKHFIANEQETNRREPSSYGLETSLSLRIWMTRPCMSFTYSLSRTWSELEWAPSCAGTRTAKRQKLIQYLLNSNL